MKRFRETPEGMGRAYNTKISARLLPGQHERLLLQEAPLCLRQLSPASLWRMGGGFAGPETEGERGCLGGGAARGRVGDWEWLGRRSQ